MRYLQQAVSLLTMHGKERVIAPVLEAGLGCTVVHTDSFDADSLGSFSRDVARTGSAWQACRRKAEMGMHLAQTALGVASEGSFTADPWSGLFPGMWKPWCSSMPPKVGTSPAWPKARHTTTKPVCRLGASWPGLPSNMAFPVTCCV